MRLPSTTLAALALSALPALAQRPPTAPPLAPPTVEQNLLPGVRAELVYTPDGVSNGAQELVLWLPETPPPANGYPVVVFFPGGAWKDPGPLPENPTGLLAVLIERGFAVARARYTFFSPQFANSGRFPAAEEDTLAAVQHLRFNADRYLLNPERLFLSGRSAGGHGVQAAALWPDRADPTALDQRRASSKPDAVLLTSVAATHVPTLMQNVNSGLAPYLGGWNNRLSSVPLADQLAGSPTQWMDDDPAGAAQIPFFVYGTPRDLELPLGQPYVLDAADHNHDPWHAAQLWLELLALGGVHWSYSVFVDLNTQPFSSEEQLALQALWCEYLVLLMDAGLL